MQPINENFLSKQEQAMSEITLHLDDALADKLLIFAEKNQTSIEEMAKNYFSGLVSDESAPLTEIEQAQLNELDKRWQAYKRGEVKTHTLEEHKAHITAYVRVKRCNLI